MPNASTSGAKATNLISLRLSGKKEKMMNSSKSSQIKDQNNGKK